MTMAPQTTHSGRAPAHWRQRRPQHGRPLRQPALLRQPPDGPDPRGSGPAHRRRLRLPPQHGRDQAVLGPGADGDHQRHRLSQAGLLALPLDGHLVHRPARDHGDGWLARQAGARPRPEGRERVDGRQLRARPAASALAGRRAGRLGRGAGLLRPADQPVERPAPVGARSVLLHVRRRLERPGPATSANATAH